MDRWGGGWVVTWWGVGGGMCVYVCVRWDMCIHTHVCGVCVGVCGNGMDAPSPTHRHHRIHPLSYRYAANASMGASAFQNSDGDLLIVPQLGCGLDGT